MTCVKHGVERIRRWSYDMYGVERIRRWLYDMCETWCRKNKKMVI